MSEVISFSDSLYPERLKAIPDPPKQLYFVGEFREDIFSNGVGIVGSRKMTIYGKKVTQMISGSLATSGITIVSGFMTGVDTEAHKSCLEVGGVTVAVMPCGVDVIHPENNYQLYQEIIENRGIIVSEFPDGHSPARWTYPKRNRIIAGLVSGVVIVEAALNSGSLITAEYAKQYGRGLYAVPGNITSQTSEGTNMLIKGGAIMATSAYDILGQSKMSFPELPEKSTEILLHILGQPCTLDELLQVFPNYEVRGLTLYLTELELKGVVTKKEGKYYAS